MQIESILANFSITALNDMQKACLEDIPQEKDVVLISPTGSGKTLAFLLPTLALLRKDWVGVQVLIIVPSRELALQIESVFKQMSTGFKINCCYGGHSVRTEENNLSEAPDVLVGTPGRLAHHVRKGNINLGSVSTLILDEFDKSLEMGFADDMKFVLWPCKHIKKRILTSATELKEIPEFVKLKEHTKIDFSVKEESYSSKLKIKKVKVPGDDKLEALLLVLGKLNAQSCIVFCNHREMVSHISDHLHKLQIEHGFYHGGLEQMDREKTLIKLRNGSTKILISTDLAARGLDIPEIEAVIHYQLPVTEDVMVHRNGRTARMHAEGTAYFLLDKNEYLPKFLKEDVDEEQLPTKFLTPQKSEWKTLYISAGKKEKVNKMDIVGTLLKKGQLQKEELGKIEVLDHVSFAAVNRKKVQRTLELLRDEKIKGKKVKIGEAS